MKGKLLRGISGSVQPRRLLRGYQDAVFAWSGENPFANLAQAPLYSILPRTQYNNNWIKSTPYGQAFRATTYSDSGHGYVFSSHVPNVDQTYSKGVTGYAEFVYSEDLQEAEYTQHLCCISSSADGTTNDTYYGVLTFGLEFYSGKGLCPFFRVGNNTTLYGFAGGSSDIGGGGSMVPVSIPVGTKVRQMVAFDPVSKAYATILTFNDSVYEESGTVPDGLASTGSSILIGGYPRNGIRAAYASGMLEAALWNRGIPPAEMRALLQRPSIFQPTEFIFPFSFGEAPAGSEVINTTPAAMALSPVQAGLISNGVLNTQAEALSLTPVSASILGTATVLTNPVTISLSSVSATVRLNEEIQAKPATISLSGVNADINISGQIQIPAIPATITLVANSATLAQHSVVNAQPDALIIQPEVAGIYAGEAVVDTAAKAITLTTGQATIVQHSVLATTAGNIGLHGAQAELHITNILATNTAHASLYGAQAGLRSREILSGNTSGIILQGNKALIRSDGVGVVDTWPDNLGIFGQKSDISMRTALAANPASMILASMRAQINYESPIVWGSTTIEARLQGMTIEARQ